MTLKKLDADQMYADANAVAQTLTGAPGQQQPVRIFLAGTDAIVLRAYNLRDEIQDRVQKSIDLTDWDRRMADYAYRQTYYETKIEEPDWMRTVVEPYLNPGADFKTPIVLYNELVGIVQRSTPPKQQESWFSQVRQHTDTTVMSYLTPIGQGFAELLAAASDPINAASREVVDTAYTVYDGFVQGLEKKYAAEIRAQAIASAKGKAAGTAIGIAAIGLMAIALLGSKKR